MKIFRSELEVGLKKKLFEISSKSMEQDSIRFYEDSIKCTISSDVSPHGYYLRGQLNVPFLEQCDRCLTDCRTYQVIHFTILLTDKSELATENEINVVYFTSQQDSLDIRPILMEYMILDRPVKNLCSEDCKGLCTSCGCCLNEEDCNCSNNANDPRWDKLKKLT
ncbi:MAG: DUF177 domain-containing protein [Fidelibacterota bacterium]